MKPHAGKTGRSETAIPTSTTSGATPAAIETRFPGSARPALGSVFGEVLGCMRSWRSLTRRARLRSPEQKTCGYTRKLFRRESHVKQRHRSVNFFTAVKT
jgi:hypothetical protein